MTTLRDGLGNLGSLMVGVGATPSDLHYGKVIVRAEQQVIAVQVLEQTPPII